MANNSQSAPLYIIIPPKNRPEATVFLPQSCVSPSLLAQAALKLPCLTTTIFVASGRFFWGMIIATRPAGSRTPQWHYFFDAKGRSAFPKGATHRKA